MVREGYKQTAIGLIPNDWEITKIGNLGDVVRGGSPRPAGDPKYFNGNYIPWLTVASLTNIPEYQLDVCEANGGLTEEGAEHSRILEVDTVIVANSGATLGVAKLLNIKCCANDGIAALINQRSGDKKYICYFINTKTKELRDVVATGNGQPNLNTTLIREIFIPFPPLPEQKLIAQALSDVDALLAALDKTIAKKRAIKTATMQQLLTGKKRLPGFGEGQGYKGSAIGVIPEDWKPCRVGEVVSFSGGSQPPRSTFIFKPRDSYTRLIQIRDYKTDAYETYIPAELAKKTCTKHDVMIGRYGPPIFQILRGIEGAYNVALIKATPSEEIDREFFYYFIKSDDLFKLMEMLSQRSSGQTGVELPALRQYPLALPSMKEQRLIATVLSDMDAEIAALETRLAKTQAIKQGMMQELLTGRVRLKIEV